MTIAFPKGRLSVGLSRSDSDLRACQALRHQCFFGTEGLDSDPHDARCQHLMVRNEKGALVATARLLFLSSGREITTSYAAQFQDLAGLAQSDAPMIEVGRFCIAPQALDADVLRIAWGAMTDIVDARGVRFLFGCSSFRGTDPARYGRAILRLRQRHLGPEDLRPSPRRAAVIPFERIAATGVEPLPPLLRTYLAMGGWVADFATIDRQMNTLHVFTCVDVTSVPPARAKALRALAQSTALA